MFYGQTFQQLGGWPGALLIAVCGLVVVFIVLAVLALMIMAISKVVAFIESFRKPAAAVPAAKPAAAPAPKKEEDDEELIAVITAAVAAEMGTTPDQTRLTSIMRY